MTVQYEHNVQVKMNKKTFKSMKKYLAGKEMTWQSFLHKKIIQTLKKAKQRRDED